MAADPDRSATGPYLISAPQPPSGMSARFAFLAGIAVGLAFFAGYWVASDDETAQLTSQAATLPPAVADGYPASQPTAAECRERKKRKARAGSGNASSGGRGSAGTTSVRVRTIENGDNSPTAGDGTAITNGPGSSLAFQGNTEGTIGRDGIIGGNNSVNIIAKDGTSIHLDDGGSQPSTSATPTTTPGVSNAVPESPPGTSPAHTPAPAQPVAGTGDDIPTSPSGQE